MDYLIIGGSGFIGQNLTRHLLDSGKLVIIKTRNKPNTQQLFEKIGCVPMVIESYDEITQDTLPQNVICLAGAGIVDKRWSPQRKKELVSSRVQPLQELAAWLKTIDASLDKLLIGSAIGYYGYGDNPEQSLNESSMPHEDFVHSICQQTEAQASHLQHFFSNIVSLRTGVVLGKNGGALAKMTLPAKFCLNGKIGNGQQWVSWIHIEDWLSAVMHIIQSKTPAKNYNLCSPNPVKNSELSQAIGSALNRKLQLPVPSVSLKLILGDTSVLLIGSQKIIPQQLINEDFQFAYTDIEEVVKSLI